MALTKISTAGVKDDAISASKIPANAVGTSELADNTVQTTKIADEAVTLTKLPHGDSNSDGKFLRANNGADPSFESIPAGTTINNNADNRVITGSGSANTLNGESSVVIDANGKLGVGTTSPDNLLHLESSSNPYLQLEKVGTSSKIYVGNASGDAVVESTGGAIKLKPNGASNKFILDTSGRLLVGLTSGIHGDEFISVQGTNNSILGIKTPNTTQSGILAFHDTGGTFRGRVQYDHDTDNLRFFAADGERGRFLAGGGLTFNGDTAAANALDDYEEGTWTPTYLFGGQDTSTYTGRGGYYTKVGNLVVAKFALDISSRGNGSGHMSIGGLPFTIADKLANTGQEVGGMISYFNNLDLNVSQINFWGQNGNNYLQLQYLNGSGSPTTQQYLQKSNINNDTGMRGYVIYQSA